MVTLLSLPQTLADRGFGQPDGMTFSASKSNSLQPRDAQ
jgi:hypothetical protein